MAPISSRAFITRLAAWLRSFAPAPINAGHSERLCAAVGAWLGVMATQWISQAALGIRDPWFIAPMGASAILLFGVPASPLAQPWSIVGGNVVAALIGVACAQAIPDPTLAASAAVACAIAAMFALRCLHPPSGAVALTAVLGGPHILEMGFRFALWPVAFNSVVLLGVAIVFNNLARRRYPHAVAHPAPRHTADPSPGERLGFTREDLEDALRRHRDFLAVNPDDLEEIFLQTELSAYRRRAGHLRCGDIMSKDVVVATPDMTVGAAWRLLTQYKIHALPVVDASDRLAGIVTLHDLVRGNSSPHAVGPRLSATLLVGQIMARRVHTARADHDIVGLIPMFSDVGHHHLPVVDDAGKVIGMVTQTDLVSALYRMRLGAPIADQAGVPAKLVAGA